MGSLAQGLGSVLAFPRPGDPRDVPSFRALPAPTRAEVEQAARRGRVHPDPLVAVSSVQWAQRRMAPRSAVARLAVILVAAASSAGLFADVPGVDGLMQWWRERRLARRILVAARRSPDYALEWERLTSSGAAVSWIEAERPAGEGGVARRRIGHA